MRINITKCDQCEKEITTDNPYCFGIKSPNILETQGINVSLKAGGNGCNSFHRDFCNEQCLRDYLVEHIPAHATAL